MALYKTIPPELCGWVNATVLKVKEISTLKLASWEVLWKSFVTVGGSEGSSVWGILFARVLFFFQFD